MALVYGAHQAAMTDDAERYRKHGEEAIRHAERAMDLTDKSEWLRLASEWMKLAESTRRENFKHSPPVTSGPYLCHKLN